MLTLALIFLFNLSTYASDYNTCEGYLQVGGDAPILTQANINKAYELGRDTSTFDKIFWERVLDIYIDRRVSLLPKNLQDTTKRELRKRKHRMRFSGYAPMAPAVNDLHMHSHFENTPLHYVYLVHEWEHMIQSLIETSGSYTLNPSATSLLNPARRYKDEAQAMRAEWEMARLMTDTEADELLEVIQYDSRSNKIGKMKEANVAHFRNLDASAYVKAHQDSGRYSAFNSTVRTLESAQVPLTFASIGLAGIGFWAGVYHCLDWVGLY